MMQRARSSKSVLVAALCALAWLACIAQGQEVQELAGTRRGGTTQTTNLRRRKDRNDCDELREMFIERGCTQQDSRRCRLLNFRLDGGRLSKRPRCQFMPCERYGQPANQTCVSTCFGTPIPGGLCEAGRTCCVQSARPPPQPKKFLCAYTCKSSVGCRDVTSGTCPFAGHVCCLDAPTHPFPNPFPSKTCVHQCVSSFDCLEEDTSGSCGHFGLNVCCKTVGSRFVYPQHAGGAGDDLLTSRSIFSGGFGNFLSLNDFGGYGSNVFNQGQLPSAKPPTRKTDQASDVQPLPCPYTCLPASACGDVDPASNANTCSGPAHVCCRVALPPPVVVTDDEKRGGRKRKTPRVTPKRATTTTTTTVAPAPTTTKPALPYSYTLKPLIIPVTAPTTISTRETETGCPFECVRANRCVEEDSSFKCGARKVCCKTKKKDDN